MSHGPIIHNKVRDNKQLQDLYTHGTYVNVFSIKKQVFNTNLTFNGN